MQKFKYLLIASAALLPPAIAHAQTDDQIIVADERVDRDIVVVASGVPQPLDEVSRSVTVFQRAEIEQRQTMVLSDLLATVPGVTVSRNGGLGTLTSVRIRGAEAEQTLVLIDGVRVNDPSSPGGGFDFANLLAGSAERVEVLRGPNSVVWGSQAIGGVVNVVTRDGSQGLSFRGNAEGGSFGTFSGTAGVSAGNDRLSGALTAGYTTTDGISAAASGTEPDGYRQFGATGQLSVRIVDNVSLDLRGYYADSKADLDGFPAPDYILADDAEYAKAQELYGYAGLKADLFGGRFHNRLAFTIADINRDNYDPAFGAEPSFFGRGRSERYEYQGDAELAQGYRAVFGAEHENSRYFDGSLRESTGITSFYGELIANPVSWASLNAGIRHDDHRDFGGHTSFGASAAIEPIAGTRLHASYGEGFKAPTLYQLFSFYGYDKLRPETAKSYELGAEQRILPGVTAKATWFHRDTDNQIDFDLGTSKYLNVARARAEGVELELVATPVTGLSLRGAYTHADAENRSPGANFGNDLARRPQDAGSISADYRFGFGLSLGGTVLVVGDSFDDAGNFTRLEGYTLAGIRAAYPVTDRIEVYGRVENLFDEKYQTVSGYGTMGRAAYGGMRLKFD
ncbi:TonB-dependent receptor [Sphingomonas sp. dw_22]|uniref:TonB-dependent receptor plug domain-containing protein n=1 Tax=Sphingomonas sp. dw_22 TaxID=2721175 RepID=UPI001BD50CF9|nr:TonB-dependent receptor [Sphingomonas sp. dw_22]